MDLMVNNKKDKYGSTSRKLIICINTIFLVISIGICGAGGLLRFGEKVWKKQFEAMLETLAVEDMDFSRLHFESMFILIGTIVMGVGLGAVFLCIVGFVSASKKNFILSLVYTILLGCLILIQCIITGIVGVKRSFVDGIIKPPLLENMQGYRGYNGTDSASQTWGFLMVTFSCCGLDGYDDFRVAVHWNRRVYQEGWWFTMKTPLPCCKMRLRQPGDFSCAVNPNDANSNFSQGCYDAVVSRGEEYRMFIFASIGVFATLQIVLLLSCLVFTVEMYKKAHKTKKDKDNTSISQNIHHQRQNDENEYIAGRNPRSLGFPYPDMFNGHSSNVFQFDRPFASMFPGYKPSMSSPFGLSSLMQSMHAMPSMGFPMFNHNRNQQFGDIDPIYTQHNQGLTSVGIPRASGPVIVQVPAITAPLERRQSSVSSIGGLTIEEIAESSALPSCSVLSDVFPLSTNHIRRQNTATVSSDEPVTNMRRQNTWQPRSFIQRENAIQRQNTVHIPTPSSLDGLKDSQPHRKLFRAKTKPDLLCPKSSVCDDDLNDPQDRNRSETF